MERFMEECTELCDRYKKGEDFCSNYLDGEISLYELTIVLKKINLDNFLLQIKEHLPQSSNVIAEYDIGVDDDSSDIKTLIRESVLLAFVNFVKNKSYNS